MKMDLRNKDNVGEIVHSSVQTTRIFQNISFVKSN